jgi:hypothetical protein
MIEYRKANAAGLSDIDELRGDLIKVRKAHMRASITLEALGRCIENLESKYNISVQLSGGSGTTSRKVLKVAVQPLAPLSLEPFARHLKAVRKAGDFTEFEINFDNAKRIRLSKLLTEFLQLIISVEPEPGSPLVGWRSHLEVEKFLEKHSKNPKRYEKNVVKRLRDELNAAEHDPFLVQTDPVLGVRFAVLARGANAVPKRKPPVSVNRRNSAPYFGSN